MSLPSFFAHEFTGCTRMRAYLRSPKTTPAAPVRAYASAISSSERLFAFLGRSISSFPSRRGDSTCRLLRFTRCSSVHRTLACIGGSWQHFVPVVTMHRKSGQTLKHNDSRVITHTCTVTLGSECTDTHLQLTQMHMRRRGICADVAQSTQVHMCACSRKAHLHSPLTNLVA